MRMVGVEMLSSKFIFWKLSNYKIPFLYLFFKLVSYNVTQFTSKREPAMVLVC